jgi:hypothetical protein
MRRRHRKDGSRQGRLVGMVMIDERPVEAVSSDRPSHPL